jgi:hypothetical protein
MTGIFPRDFDGGLPANPNTPNDPAQAFLHRHRLPIDTPALYYGNGCDVRLRPHVVNSLISEIASIADRAGVGYRASSLQNLERSVRYLIQRGLPHAGMLVQQNPWHFDFSVNPAPPCYTDFMTVTFVPRMPPDTDWNQGFVRINMNGLGYVPLYRWDGNECRAGDILPLKPFMAAYFNGAWYIIGRIPPEFRPGGIDLWVRTDGNDATGDGTRNTPDKAFRTIMGAFRSVGERFMATPLFVAHIKLGIPGTYEAAYLGPFGGGLTITGGGADGGGWGTGSRFDYNINSAYYAGEARWIALGLFGINSVGLYGLTMMLNAPGGAASTLLVGGRTNASLENCAFNAYTSNPGGWFIDIRDSSLGHSEPPGSVHYFLGNGVSLAGAVTIARGVYIACANPGHTMVSTNFFMYDAYLRMNQLAACTFGGYAQHAWGNVSGRQFSVSTNSVLYHNSEGLSGPIPGTEPGTYGTGAQVIVGG